MNRGVRHRGVICVADPDTSHEVGSVAERPVVKDQFSGIPSRGPGGAGLGRGGNGRFKIELRSEHPRAGIIVREDGRDEIGVFGADNLFARGRLVFVNHIAFEIGDFQNRDRRDALSLLANTA